MYGLRWPWMVMRDLEWLWVAMNGSKIDIGSIKFSVFKFGEYFNLFQRFYL